MTVNPSELWPLVAIIAAGVGCVGWLYNRLQANKDDLASHKLHCAENFVSKEGLKEVRDEIMHGVRDLRTSVDISMRDMKASVDGLNSRIDRVAESRATTSRTRSSDRSS